MCMSGFSVLEDCGPPQYPKNQLFSLPGESPHRNLITHPVLSITKESDCQNNSSSNFPLTPSKNTPPSKISNCPEMSSFSAPLNAISMALC